jgi:hypothetical protein
VLASANEPVELFGDFSQVALGAAAEFVALALKAHMCFGNSEFLLYSFAFLFPAFLELIQGFEAILELLYQRLHLVVGHLS